MKRSNAADLVKLIEHQDSGGQNVENQYYEEMENVAVLRLRFCLLIFIFLFPFLAVVDFATRGFDQVAFSISSRIILELVLFSFAGLTYISQFRRNVYAFAFMITMAISVHNVLTLAVEGPSAMDHYILFGLVFALLGTVMPWGGQAIAGICFPSFLFYPVGTILFRVTMTENFFIKSNLYLILFMLIVIVAASVNESIRLKEYILRKRLEEENIIMQGYQTRLKRAYERMENLAIIDPLTRVYNRMYLTQWLTTDVYKYKSASEVFSMIMYDLDRFKEINDSAGHQMGDRILQRLTEIVQEELNKDALMFRYGGDEFCLILPGVDLANAVKTADRIRRRVDGHPDLVVKFSSMESIQATISIGVTTEYVSGTIDQNYLIRWLDAALLESKRQGRNCIYVFDPVERRIRNAFQWLEHTGS